MNNKQYLQCPDNGSLQTFSTQYSMVTGPFSPSGNFNDIYSTLLPQNSASRGQNRPHESSYSYPFSELPSWDNLKLPEKNYLTENASKDLSPNSFSCTNIDILPSENQYAKYDGHQWPSTVSGYAPKPREYSSCAQMSKYGDTRSSAYCSIQKGPSEAERFKSCIYYNTDTCYNQNKPTEEAAHTIYSNYPSYFDPKCPDSSTSNNYYTENFNTYASTTLPSKPENTTNKQPTYNLTNITCVDQQTDDESDIIVEDSSSDCSEEQEKQLFYKTTKCLLCNTIYTPLGIQFFVVTSQNPLTMSSQTPVVKKLLDLVNNKIWEEKTYLCNDCLSLINTIDHLQVKLDYLTKNLLKKFKSSCLENNVLYETKNQSSKQLEFKRFKCKRCNKILCLKNYFSNHIKAHKFRGYLCELCGKIAPTFKKLKYHLENHKRKVATNFFLKCSNKNCKKTFKTKSHLKEHENFCLGILPFKCKNQLCDKKFASATKLKSHVKLKHDKKFVAICSICNIGFVKVSDYKSHMVTHNTAKKYPCNKCPKSYKTLSNLNFHLKIHEKTLPFTCSICFKGFMRKEYHEAHVNNHNGIKNFGCSVCDKKFVSQKNLDAHLKYHEGSAKTNTCSICGKVITSGFEEHLRVHSNLKEFECDLCNLKFNTKNTLAKHRKRKHKDRSNKSEKTNKK